MSSPVFTAVAFLSVCAGVVVCVGVVSFLGSTGVVGSVFGSSLTIL